VTTKSEDLAHSDPVLLALLDAMTHPLTPEDVQRASEGFTCGYVPAARSHLYHDEDWFRDTTTD